MSARTRLSPGEFAELQRRRQASAEAATRGRAHRALPLDEVEARQRLQRKPWPAEPEHTPTEAASAVSELLADPPRPAPPAYPWRALGAGLLVLMVTVSAVHVIAGAITRTQVAAR